MEHENYVIIAEGGTTYGVYESDNFGGVVGKFEIDSDDEDEIIDAAKNEFELSGNFDVR